MTGRRLELVNALSRPACVMIMSDCKLINLKNVRVDEGCSFHRSLAGSDILCPNFTEFGGAYRVCMVCYFFHVFLSGLKHCFG